jgi:hypothetical protein
MRVGMMDTALAGGLSVDASFIEGDPVLKLMGGLSRGRSVVKIFDRSLTTGTFAGVHGWIISVNLFANWKPFRNLTMKVRLVV